MKVTFTLPVIVASVVPVIAHPAVVQAVESMLNAGKQIGDGTASMKNNRKDSHADLELTFVTRQSMSVVTCFKEYCEAVEKMDGKAQKLGASPLVLASIPDKFKGQAIGDWVARLVSNATAQVEQAAKDKEAADAKAKADAKAAIEASKAIRKARKSKGAAVPA